MSKWNKLCGDYIFKDILVQFSPGKFIYADFKFRGLIQSYRPHIPMVVFGTSIMMTYIEATVSDNLTTQ